MGGAEHTDGKRFEKGAQARIADFKTPETAAAPQTRSIAVEVYAGERRTGSKMVLQALAHSAGGFWCAAHMQDFAGPAVDYIHALAGWSFQTCACAGERRHRG